MVLPAILLIVLVALTAATAPVTEASARASVAPHVGGPREAFVVRAIAPYRTYGEYGEEEPVAYYEADVRGPQPCAREASNVITSPVRVLPGDRVTLLLSPWDRIDHWCRGRYVAHIDFFRLDRDGDVLFRQRIASKLAFRVRENRPRSPLRVSPALGGPRETFVLRFVAPLRTFEEFGEFFSGAAYRFVARGPGRCRRLVADTSSQFALPVLPGDRAVITLDRYDLRPRRRRWCPGRYVGRIEWLRLEDEKVEFRRPVRSGITFRVRA